MSLSTSPGQRFRNRCIWVTISRPSSWHRAASITCGCLSQACHVHVLLGCGTREKPSDVEVADAVF